MDNATLSSQILSLLRTSQDAHIVEESLNQLTSTLFSTKSQDAVNVFSHLPKKAADLLRESFLSKPITDLNREQIQKSIEAIQKKLQESKALQITLCFNPTETFLDHISSWIKKELGQEILFDIEVNPQILGGLIITANGVYRDYSVKKKLADVFEKQQDKIREILE